uniref:Uncharacterized protein n=1 Tax=Sphaerodactylus townsendi TaxID=933632 RepID=A0ACB8E8Q6_9SAUR
MVLDSLARIIKVQLPAYLKRLPIPESISGFLRLTDLDCRNIAVLVQCENTHSRHIKLLIQNGHSKWGQLVENLLQPTEQPWDPADRSPEMHFQNGAQRTGPGGKLPLTF